MLAAKQEESNLVMELVKQLQQMNTAIKSLESNSNNQQKETEILIPAQDKHGNAIVGPMDAVPIGTVIVPPKKRI